MQFSEIVMSRPPENLATVYSKEGLLRTLMILQGVSWKFLKLMKLRRTQERYHDDDDPI